MGAILALTLLWSSRPEADPGELGAHVTFHANLTGELGVAPAGPEPFLRDDALRPGGTTEGTFDLTNQTGAPLTIRFRALSSEPSLDEFLQVALSSHGTALASGTLASLGTPGGTPLVLSPGETRPVSLTATLDPAAGPAAAAALVDVGVSFALGDPAGGSKRKGGG
jgi:hypothetical protein